MNLSEKINKLKNEASNLETLIEEFPDLHEYPGRWQTFLSSKKVNDNPEKINYGHSCGCCEDAALYIYFYVERLGTKVYSDPPFICIGSKNEYYGEIEDESRYILNENREETVNKIIGKKAWELAKEFISEEFDVS